MSELVGRSGDGVGGSVGTGMEHDLLTDVEATVANHHAPLRGSQLKGASHSTVTPVASAASVT